MNDLSRPGMRAADVPHDTLGMEAFRVIDRMREAWSARITGGLSPAAVALALFDWSIHLASAPGKRLELIDKAVRTNARLSAYLYAAGFNNNTPPCIEALPGDYRFRSEVRKDQPYAAYAQAFLLGQQWWHNTTREVPGVAPHNEDVVSFAVRQILDMFSPSNNLGPDEWAAEAEDRDGSWWDAWLPWLAGHSGKVRVAPPQLGTADKGFPAIAEAPGTYVFQK